MNNPLGKPILPYDRGIINFHYPMHQEILVIKKGCHRDILWGIMSGEPLGGLKPLSPREGSRPYLPLQEALCRARGR